MAKHAELSPSSAKQWMTCPGSIVLCAGLPRDDNEYSMEGTCAHFLAAFCLENGNNPRNYTHAEILIQQNRETKEQRECFNNSIAHDPSWETLYKLKPSKDFCDSVGDYVDYVRDVRDSTKSTLLVEQALSIEHITLEEGAKGTSDAVLFNDTEVCIIDLKFGMGVKVDAEKNPQLLCYASAAYSALNLVLPDTIETVRMVIHQPRLNHVSEDVIPLEELVLGFDPKVRAAAVKVDEAKRDQRAVTWVDDYLVVSDEGCRFCKAKADCPKLTEFVSQQMDAEFDDLTAVEKHVAEYDAAALSTKAKAIDIIESWCKAVRARVEGLLLQGVTVPDFKLVQGKRGHRKWIDEAEAEALLKASGLTEQEIFEMKLITPTVAEKGLKHRPDLWANILPNVTQSEGSPSVAPADDPRPALNITAVGDEMEDLTGGGLV